MMYRILLILAALLTAPLAHAAPSTDARREIAQLIQSSCLFVRDSGAESALA